ncbi:CoA-binding protein [Tumebacillus sp. ITR2]|uniref:CoA-binding protein n=1 Tax=Tumebacillus amylolyticus TaxID=2801339 RepID=A0ABS1JBJ6_9BACL|nr:CoA-binding protein [Tumebacillus amylolyticus]MBL0387646.1 CoA-binding protein [Tumebacillus amylolyticus]
MSNFQNPTDEELVNVLKRSKDIAVVGLSGEVTKPSHKVAEYLQSQGYELIPINPNLDSVLGRKSHKSLLDVEGNVDIVNVFRRSHELMEIVEQAIQIKAKVVWAQLEIADEAAAKRAQEAGITVVMDKCLKIEHARLLGKEKL